MEVSFEGEQISLVCPVTQRLFDQPVRTMRCGAHSAAFCALALPSLRIRVTSHLPQPAEPQYKCPICDALFESAHLLIDGPLAEFIALQPEQRTALVKRTAGNQLTYRRAPTKRSRKRAETDLNCRAESSSGGVNRHIRAKPSSDLEGWVLPPAPCHPPRRPQSASNNRAGYSASSGGPAHSSCSSVTQDKGQRRTERRRQRQLDEDRARCKQQLIQRALYAEHPEGPESHGYCLWH